MFFILGFFLALTLQNAGIFGVDVVYMADPTKMLKRAENAENHGDYDTAIDIYRQLTPKYEKALGTDHPNTLKLLVQLYLVYFKAEKYSDALPTAWKLYKINKKRHGEENEDTIEFLSGLGRIYYNTGKHEKAEQLWKRAYRLIKSKLGQNHKKTVRNLLALAHLYQVSGNPQKLNLAFQYYQKVYDVCSKNPTPTPTPEMPVDEDQELGLEALRLGGMVLGLQQKFKEAAQVFKKVMEISSRTLGVDHPLTDKARKSLVHALSGDGKTGQANEILRTVDPGKEEDEAFYLLVDAKAEALEKQGKYSKAIQILAELYEHEMLKPQVPVNFLAILYKLLRYSRQQGDSEQVIKWASTAIDLVQNQKVKVISAKDRRNLILFRLEAIDSLIYVYSEQNDEARVEDWHQIARSTEVAKGQEGQEGLTFRVVLGKFLGVVISVAKFKEKIGKTEEALTEYLKIVRNPQGGTAFLPALTAIVNISIKKDDYILLTNIAQNCLQHCQSDPEETEEKVEFREPVASHLLKKANEDFHFRNYESAFSVLKIVETIWPKKWEADFSITSAFLEGIATAAFKAKKFNEGFFYLEKAMSLHKEKLTSEREMDDEERERVVKKMEFLVQIQNGTGRFPKSLNFGESCQTYENVTLSSLSKSDGDTRGKSEL